MYIFSGIVRAGLAMHQRKHKCGHFSFVVTQCTATAFLIDGLSSRKPFSFHLWNSSPHSELRLPGSWKLSNVRQNYWMTWLSAIWTDHRSFESSFESSQSNKIHFRPLQRSREKWTEEKIQFNVTVEINMLSDSETAAKRNSKSLWEELKTKRKKKYTVIR